MTKHKLQLDAVRKISETVKEKIDTHYKYIEEFNEKNQDLDSVEKELEKLEDQLILLKEVIQNANKNKHKDSKRSNNYYIYRLSNLKTREIWLRELRIKDNDDAYITEEEIDEQLRNISDERLKLKSRLTAFNRDTVVTVELDDSLNLLIE